MFEYGLQDDDKQIILDILKTYPQIEEGVLFGSRALNTFKVTSDVDLAIKGKDIHSILAALMADFEEFDLIYEVDLVDYASISTEKLLEHIDRHGKVFYRKGWVETTLGEVVNIKYGKDHKHLANGVYPLYGSGGIMRHVEKPLYEKESILIPRKGTLSNLFYVDKPFWSVDTIFYTEIDNEKVNPLFLFYKLKTINLAGLDVGSAVPSLTTKVLNPLELYIPYLPEQKSIAKLLSSFDEKIELLREQNKTLETLAQTIFKEWFVNFNYPGATGEMVDSELGEIPKGWRVEALGTLIKTNGSSIKRNSEIDVIEYLDTGSITEGHIESTQKIHLADAPSRARRIVQHNDLLISTVRPNLKHYGILKEPADNFIVSTGFCVITCDKADPHFVYYLLTTNDMTDYLHSVAEGSTSTYPSIKPSDIEKIEYAFPPENILKLFSGYADKAWNKIIFNQTQIIELSKTRDTLLPKLMSGQVRVGEAQWLN